jgi:hypothetical protein
MTGSVKLWALTNEEGMETGFSISSTTWTPVVVPLEVLQAGHTGLKLQIYLTTANWNMEVDAAANSVAFTR